MPLRSAEDELILSLPEERKAPFSKLRQTIKSNLPNGFEERVGGGMFHYVVPLSTYPKGYHANPGQPLGFISIACQKNFIAMYHMGLYGSMDLLNWFKEAYTGHSKTKLDMGKSCVRFKKPENIPYDLIATLVKKISPQDWIGIYEKALAR